MRTYDVPPSPTKTNYVGDILEIYNKMFYLGQGIFDHVTDIKKYTFL